MKKLFISLFALSSFFTSCNKSVEQQAQSLIKDNMSESVAYEAIETRVDSAYAPLENPELYKLFDKYVKATNDLMVHHRMITEMQTKMGKFTDMYSDSLIAKLNPIISSLEGYVSLMENMDRMMDMPREFVGYKVVHRYKVNIGGKDIEQKDMVMFNKDMSSIEHQMRYSNYEFVCAEIEKMKSNMKSTIETYRTTIEIAKKLAE